MAKKKTAAKAEVTPTIVRNYDLQSLESRVTALDKKVVRSYDIFSIEQRIFDLEKNGGGGGGSATYEIELGTPKTGTSVTLEKDKHYIFSTVYNGGTFNGAQIVAGNTASAYIASEIGRACCVIRALQTSVTYSNGGAVSPNKFVPITIKKNGEDITSFVFGLSTYANGTSISAATNERYLIISNKTSDLISGAEVEGTFDLGITTGVTDSTVFVVKATSDTIKYGTNTMYYIRLIGGDMFV